MVEEDEHHAIHEITGSNAVSMLKRILQDTELSSVNKIRIEIYSDEELTTVDRREGEQQEPEPEEEQDHVPHVGTDTDAFAILEQLSEFEDFVDMPTIRQQSPDFQAGESLSGTLWSVSDRGLVEKKDHPRDGRKKVYKLTSKGENALEKAQEA